MPFSTTRLLSAVLAGSLLSSGAAFAQAKKPAAPAHPAAPAAPAQPAPADGAAAGGQQAPQGPVKVDLISIQPKWTKLCGKDQAANKEICLTTRDFGVKPEQGPILAVAVNDVKGEDTRIVRLLLPLGLLLKPGFRFAVDKGPTNEGSYDICAPNGCFAEVKVKGSLIDSMKKGTSLIISVRNQVNNQVDFAVPLADFGEGFDGPPVDPKVLEEQQKKLQEELQKRAEEERKRLEAAQSANSGKPATPAPAGTPAPAAPKP